MRTALILIAATCWAQSMPFPGPGSPHTTSCVGICFGNTGSADTTSSASTLATAAFSVTSGNLVVCLVDTAAAQTVSSVTDSQSNSYTLMTAQTVGSQNESQFAYAKNVTGSASLVVTAHFSASTAKSGIACQEISGVSTTTPVDLDYNSGTNNGLITTTTNLFDSGYTTSTAAEAVVIGCGADRVLASAFTIDHSYATQAQSPQFLAGISGKVTTSTISGELPVMTTATAAFFACTLASFK